MGRYRSDDSDDEYSKKSKKKKKRRGRSRSSSDSESSRMSSSRNKKSKKKHRRSSRSRSHSVERRRDQDGRSSRRSRSGSADRFSSRKHRSDSRSHDRRGTRKSRSRSPPPKWGRSRSPSSRRRRSKSYSRGRRSKSRSTSRGRRRGSRSRSYDRTNSQRSSTERWKDTLHSTASPSSVTVQGLSISEQVPGFSEMTPAEQAEERMRLALKAAAAADEKLKGRTFMDSVGVGSAASAASTFGDSKHFADSVASIESSSFVQSSFKSSRSTKVKEEPAESHATHDDAIFGSLAVTGFTLTPDLDTKPVGLDPDSIMHPSLYCDPEEKMDKWIQRLSQLRKRKLEGEAM